MSSLITAPGWSRAIGSTIIPGGAAGDHAVPGPISLNDDLLSVVHVSADLVTLEDLTSEFSITAAGVVNNNAGTNTSSNFLALMWAQGIA